MCVCDSLTMVLCPIQGVFLHHTQCSRDRLWIHYDLEQKVKQWWRQIILKALHYWAKSYSIWLHGLRLYQSMACVYLNNLFRTSTNDREESMVWLYLHTNYESTTVCQCNPIATFLKLKIIINRHSGAMWKKNSPLGPCP